MLMDMDINKVEMQVTRLGMQACISACTCSPASLAFFRGDGGGVEIHGWVEGRGLEGQTGSY